MIIVFILANKQTRLQLLQSLASTRPRRGRTASKPQAWQLAASVMAAVAGTLGQYLRPPSRSAGPTTLTF